MPSSNNEAVCIAGSSIEGEVEVKLVAKFLLNILSVAIKNVRVATNNIILHVSWASQPFAQQTSKAKKQ